ncbi:MAG: IS21-like element helper ATPase IstB [Thermoanaerobaculia bacterium]
MSRATIVEPPHLMADLKQLKLPTFAQQWSRLAEEAARRRQPHGEYLADLAHLEVTERRDKRIRRRIAEARFPVLKTLDTFDFAAQPSLDEAATRDLFRCDFVAERANVVLLGGVGTGKTHLAIALGIACCQRDWRVRFTTAAELTNALVEAKAAGRLSRKIEQLAAFDVVAIDELGYVPFDKHGADLLFGFVTRVYERRSLLVTTNLPFGRWSEVFLDATAAAAVIDRIVHHATVLKTDGESYRLRAAKSTKGERSRKTAPAVEAATRA